MPAAIYKKFHELFKIQSIQGKIAEFARLTMEVFMTSNIQVRTVERKCAYPCCIVQHAIYFIVREPIVQNGTPKWKIKSYQVQNLQVRAF